MLLILLVGLISYGLYHLLRLGSRPPNFPPGPPTEPIFGNLRQLPAFFQETIFSEWAKKYGPVFSIMKGACPYIVVNEQNAARELFTKLGQNTSARPDLPTELIIRGNYQPAMQNGPVWRVARRQWHGMLNVSAARKYLPYQMLEATRLLYDLLDAPEEWEKHIPRYSNSVSMSMTAGYRVPSSNDPIVGTILKSFEKAAGYNLEYNWANFYPFLFKMPDFLSVPLRKGSQIFAEYRDHVLESFRRVQNENLPSFYQVIRENQGPMGLTDNEVATLAEILAGAGTETTANSIHGWVAAMALFPEVQRKAQEEIDRVVGLDRLPRDEDAANLVYVRQVVQELHRWFTVAPLGLAHAAAKSFEWRGLKIPQGTGLVFNTMAMHHDPEKYPQPDEFIPERWEGKVEMPSEDSLGANSELFTFGAGRRICPGQHLAERSIYIVVSHWLWAFNIKKARDQSGKEIPIETKITKPGLARMFLPFEVEITPRSEAKSELIRETWARLKDELLTADEQWKNTPEEVRSVVEKVKSQKSHSK